MGDAGRDRAWEDFVRAALLAPERVLDAGRFAPAVLETWRRAAAEAHRRPRGVLVVRAPIGARVSVDGCPPVAAPAVVSGLIHGEHLVRVEEPGRVPWATPALLTAPALEIDVPARAVLALDDRGALERGRHAGADAVLTAAPLEAGASDPAGALLELRLSASPRQPARERDRSRRPRRRGPGARGPAPAGRWGAPAGIAERGAALVALAGRGGRDRDRGGGDRHRRQLGRRRRPRRLLRHRRSARSGEIACARASVTAAATVAGTDACDA